MSAVRARVRRAISFGIGAALLLAAVLAARGAGISAADSWRAIAAAPPAYPLALAALTLITVPLTAAVFWLITTRAGPVPRLEMTALIACAWLLNYLPLSPGLFGRLAWHARFHRISLTSGGVAVVWATVLSALAAAATLVAVLVVSLLGLAPGWGAAVLALAPAALGAVGAWRAYVAPPAPDPVLWKLLAAFALRCIEVQVWAGRYAACFAMLGQPIAWPACLVLSCAASLASLLPIAGNGLGVREWVIGLIAPLLPIALTGRLAPAMPEALATDLAHRAIEVLLAIPLGLLAAGWLWRRARRATGASRA